MVYCNLYQQCDKNYLLFSLPVTITKLHVLSVPCTLIAERLSVRHIIVRARRALMGPYSEVVLVCMYVCLSVTGLRLKYTSLRMCMYPPARAPLGALELTQSSRYDGRLRGATTMPGQRTRPEVQKTFK